MPICDDNKCMSDDNVFEYCFTLVAIRAIKRRTIKRVRCVIFKYKEAKIIYHIFFIFIKLAIFNLLTLRFNFCV